MRDYYYLKEKTRAIYNGALVFTLLFTGLFSSAQQKIINLVQEKTATIILHDDLQCLKTLFTYDKVVATEVETRNGSYCEILIPGTFFIGDPGFPKLPATRKLIEIPFGATVSLRILGYTSKEYSLQSYGINNKIIPVQPSIRKDQDIELIPFVYNRDIYEKHGFIEHEIATVEVLGVLRGTRLARLTIVPVSYNPVQNILRVYNDIQVEVSFTHADVAHIGQIKASTQSIYFKPIHNQLLNNPISENLSYIDLIKYPVKYLIIADRIFEADLQPFIEWKTRKGFKMILAFTDEIGTDFTSIQQWVHNQYNAATPENPAPSFLLLVGDTPLIPASTGSSTGKQTDLYYASVDGDYFPEMYYGRLSANNSNQLISQIEKILFYEKYQFTDPSFLDKATLVAGADGVWNPWVGQPTVKYATNNYYNSSNGYSEVYAYLTSPYTGCYDPEKIAVGFINYTAHCNEIIWNSPALTQPLIYNFSNLGQYPLVIGNCCLSSDFGYPECIGESWMRAPGKGAVAYIGSAPNSYWLEDFYWSVGAFPAQGYNYGYVPTISETTTGAYDAPFLSDYTSIGGLVFAGNLAVTEAQIQGFNTQAGAQYYWQAYNILGDPSIAVFHTQGSPNNVSHSSIFPMGIDVFEVQAEPGSYVAISKDGILYGTAFTDFSGKAEVVVQPVFSTGEMEIVVTKPQYIPYQTQIPVSQSETPHVIVFENAISDQQGNQNGLADYGEIIGIHLTLKNVGSTPSGELAISLSETDDYLELESDSVINTGILGSWENLLLENAFAFSVAGFVPDQHKALIVLHITDDNYTWTSTVEICIQAPVLVISDNYVINDSITGNNNGIFEPGETVQIMFDILNAGHSDISDISIDAVSGDNLLSVMTGSISLVTLNQGESSGLIFILASDASLPIDYPVSLGVYAAGGTDGLYTGSQTYSFNLGRIPSYILNNETITTCYGRFYDSGGNDGNYSNIEDLATTFFPAEAEAMIRIRFISFSTEQSYDKLFIYNGTDTLSPQFPGSPFHGSNAPGILTAMNADGAITLRFISDMVSTSSGWEAEISCYTPIIPPLCARNPFPSDEGTDLSVTTNLSWASEDASSFDIFIGKTINPPFISTIHTASFTPELDPKTTYFWKVKPRNSAGYAENCPIWSFTTGKTEIQMTDTSFSVNDGFFYDSGGSDNNYESYEDIVTTFFPFVSGYKLRFDFVEFETDADLGLLYIFNGADTSAAMFPGSPFHGDTSPATIISTDTSGSITFRFVSGDGSGKPGWMAKIRCTGPLAVFPSLSQDSVCEGHSAQLYANATGGTGNYSFQWLPASGMNNPEIENPVVIPSISTTYTVMVNDDENTVVGEQNITVNQNSLFNFGNDTTLCANFTLLLDATIPDGVSYFWMPENQNTPYILIDSTGIGIGAKIFTVTVTDVYGCVNQASIRVAFDACTFVGNQDNGIEISVYPNPAGSLMNINVKGYVGEISYALLNPQGQVVYTNSFNNLSGLFSDRINTSCLSRGLYYLQLYLQESIITRKIILY